MTTINSLVPQVNIPLSPAEIRQRFLSTGVSNQKQVKTHDIQLDLLRRKLAREADYEPPEAYWRALWDKPSDFGRTKQTKVTLQVQGSVVRVKSRREGGQAGAAFERNWNKKPDDWGENFLLDGYDRLNPHDRIQYVKRVKRGNKSDIKEFSRASRRNLIDRMCSLKVDHWLRSQFVTLTYHNEWPNPEGAKAHLRAFYKRIEYYCRRRALNYDPAIIWRVEPQKRGAPHFHLFLFNAPKIPCHMLLQWWQEITGDPTITQVDREFLTTRRKAMNYLAKYISKVGEGEAVSSDEGALLDIALYWAKAGRYWGSEGLTDDMYAPINQLVVEVTNEGLLRFVAVLENAFSFLVDRRSFGFKIFTYDKPADSIWALAALLIHGELVDNSAGLDEWLPHYSFIPNDECLVSV